MILIESAHANFLYRVQLSLPKAYKDMKRTKIAVIFHRLGPYHLARLSAAALKCDLAAIELTAIDNTYQWDVVQGANNFKRVTVFPSDNEAKDTGLLVQQLGSVLNEIQPELLVIPGWSEKSSLVALQWAQEAGIPSVVMSESQKGDFDRLSWKEWIKQRLIRLFSAGLAGGIPHVSYLRSLGMPYDRIFAGYDVVDNEYFTATAEKVRCIPGERDRLRLPADFFLASSRFVEKKNLSRVLEAYAAYRKQVGSVAWKLVIIGDGPLHEMIMQQRRELQLENDILLAGFKQYDELPTYYGFAGAFIQASTVEQWGLVVNEAMASGLPVLVSNRCGCAPDLVHNGRNGFTFDPYDVEELAGLMVTISSGEYDLAEMGRASRTIITDWGPERFADGFLKAAEAALAAPLLHPTLLDRMLLKGLIHR